MIRLDYFKHNSHYFLILILKTFFYMLVCHVWPIISRSQNKCNKILAVKGKLRKLTPCSMPWRFVFVMHIPPNILSTSIMPLPLLPLTQSPSLPQSAATANSSLTIGTQNTCPMLTLTLRRYHASQKSLLGIMASMPISDKVRIRLLRLAVPEIFFLSWTAHQGC